MSSLPSGTVTFLFTDIEGSTKLAQEYPDKWEWLQQRHHTILQSVIESHNGYVFQIIGDAFCAAFHTAKDGLNAAIEAQRKLQTGDWDQTPVKVRMGLHTGSAEFDGNNYHGYMTMARVQRVMSVAYGGQTLLSNASAELVHNELPDGIALRDMKEHHLKSLFHPEQLWQIVAPDLQQNFPALQSLNETPNNLPIQLTSFIGREKEVGQIKKRLEKNRLVTLTGSGGIGKTRLSIQVASELLSKYPNGVWLVELASLTDPTLVTSTVCTALSVAPQGNTPALNVLTDYLRAKKILLLVDNCEHLIDACVQLCDSLLHACPDLQIIASSRETLGIDGENAYRVPSLSLPDSYTALHAIEESEAVKLFIERATALLPDFEITESNAPVIAEICQRLDGIALAIELAASRVKILKVEQIASRLDDAFCLLTGGSRTALPRQQTLRALIDWSYNLLSDEERTVLRSLSVFMGGWTLDAAEAVCRNPNILDLLIHLVDKSLVAVDREHGDETHYYLLETIRQYAREKLIEASENVTLCNQHLDFFMKLAEATEPKLHSQTQLLCLNRLGIDHDNFRAALEWSQNGGDARAGLRIATALWWFWNLLSLYREGYGWFERILAHELIESAALRARALYRAGHLAIFVGEPVERTRALLHESLELNSKLEDKVGCAYSLIMLGWVTEETEASYKEALALARQTDDKWLVSVVLQNFGAFMINREPKQAATYFNESLIQFRKLGDRWGLAWSLLDRAQLGRLQGEDEQAIGFLEESLKLFRELGYKVGIRNVLSEQANKSIAQGNYDQASELFEESLVLALEVGNKRGIADGLLDLGSTVYHQGDYQRAAALMAESLTSYSEQGVIEKIPACLAGLARVNAALENTEKAAWLFGGVDALREQLGISLNPVERAESDLMINGVKSKLGEADFNSFWEAGNQMSLDEAVAYAMKQLQ